MATLTRVFTGELREDGTRQLSVRVLTEEGSSFDIQSGLYFSTEYLIDGNLNFFKKRTGSKEELKYQQEKRELFEKHYDRIENIMRVSEGHISPITLDWVLTVMTLDDQGQIKKKGRWINLRDILLAAGQSPDVRVRIKGRRELYYFTKQYCMAYDLSASTRERYFNFSRALKKAELYYQLILKDADFTLDVDLMTSETIDKTRDFFLNEGYIAAKHPDGYKMICQLSNQSFPQKKAPVTNNKNRNIAIFHLIEMKSVLKYLRFEARETDNYPFKNYEVGVWQTNRLPISLSSYELNQIRKLDLSDNPFLSAQRDILVFHCLTGCRYRDMIKLSDVNLEDDELVYEPEINVKEVIPAEPVIKLVKESKELIEQYEGVDSRFRLFPFISKLYYEDRCKSILKMAKVDRIVFVRDPKQRKIVGKPLYEVFDSQVPVNTYRSQKDNDESLTDQKEDSKAKHIEKEKPNVPSAYRGIDDDVLIAAISLIE